MKCYDECRIKKIKCQEKSCRLWIDYPNDLNCTEIAVQKEGDMILREIAERMHLTPSRIKQIENEAIKKATRILAKLNII